MSSSLNPYGPPLGPSCYQICPSWGQVGPKLEPIGPSWGLADVDPKSGQCCGHVGSERCVCTMLGRSAHANYRSPMHFLALCPGGTWPPPGLKLHQSDRPVRSYPSLPNYHASGAGGFFHVWGLFFIFKLDFWLWEFHHGSRSLS